MAPLLPSLSAQGADNTASYDRAGQQHASCPAIQLATAGFLCLALCQRMWLCAPVQHSQPHCSVLAPAALEHTHRRALQALTAILIHVIF